MSVQRLVLLRHGQTDHNVSGRMQGHLDSRLTSGGREQAGEAAPMVAGLRPALLISSDLRRAVDTAEIVGSACGLPVELDARLRETHLGEWQGRSVAEIEARWPGAIATWRSDPAWAPPGGESRLEVVRRSRPVVEEIEEKLADQPGATAVVVAHGGLIAGLVSALLTLPPSAWPSIGGLGNGRWATLARREDHPRWRLAGYNVGPGV